MLFSTKLVMVEGGGGRSLMGLSSLPQLTLQVQEGKCSCV